MSRLRHLKMSLKFELYFKSWILILIGTRGFLFERSKKRKTDRRRGESQKKIEVRW